MLKSSFFYTEEEGYKIKMTDTIRENLYENCYCFTVLFATNSWQIKADKNFYIWTRDRMVNSFGGCYLFKCSQFVSTLFDLLMYTNV